MRRLHVRALGAAGCQLLTYSCTRTPRCSRYSPLLSSFGSGSVGAPAGTVGQGPVPLAPLQYGRRWTASRGPCMGRRRSSGGSRVILGMIVLRTTSRSGRGCRRGFISDCRLRLWMGLESIERLCPCRSRRAQSILEGPFCWTRLSRFQYQSRFLASLTMSRG